MSQFQTPQTLGTSGAKYVGGQRVKPPEIFGVAPYYKRKPIIGMAYLVLALVGIAITYFTVILPSRAGPVHMEFKYQDYMPLIIPALIAWAVWDGYKIKRAYEFKVTIDEQRITVGSVTLLWSEIVRCEFLPASGWDPAIVLYRNAGDPVNIPAAVEAVEYLAGIVRRHVKTGTPAQ